MEFENTLNDITESDLQTRVESLIKLKQLPDVSLEEEVTRNWSEIISEEYVFNRLEQEVRPCICRPFSQFQLIDFFLIFFFII